jgi:uncharacterized protein (DUF2345 family)
MLWELTTLNWEVSSLKQKITQYTEKYNTLQSTSRAFKVNSSGKVVFQCSGNVTLEGGGSQAVITGGSATLKGSGSSLVVNAGGISTGDNVKLC